jgi:hypothetical protein
VNKVALSKKSFFYNRSVGFLCTWVPHRDTSKVINQQTIQQKDRFFGTSANLVDVGEFPAKTTAKWPSTETRDQLRPAKQVSIAFEGENKEHGSR